MRVIVKNARLSFNDLFKAKKVGQNNDPKFSITGICSDETTLRLKKDDGTPFTKPHEFMEQVANKVYEDKFGRVDAVYDNWCYNKADGSTTRKKYVDRKTGQYHPGFDADTLFVSAAKKIDQVDGDQITVLDQGKNPIKAGDKRLYPGCYVNILIDVYAFENEDGGKGVSASLEGVQLLREGERFTAPPVNAEDEFEAEEIPESEEDDDDWG